MKSLMSLMFLVLTFSVQAQTTTPAPQDLTKCKLYVSTLGTSDVTVLEFKDANDPTNPMTGAFNQRKAIYKSFEVLLIQWQERTAINFQDSSKEVFFASEFRDGFSYASRENGVQVNATIYCQH